MAVKTVARIARSLANISVQLISNLSLGRHFTGDSFRCIFVNEKFCILGWRVKTLVNLRILKISILKKTVSLNVLVRYFVWNFEGFLWNSTQNTLQIHWKICRSLISEDLRAPRLTSSQVFLKRPWSPNSTVAPSWKQYLFANMKSIGLTLDRSNWLWINCDYRNQMARLRYKTTGDVW